MFRHEVVGLAIAAASNRPCVVLEALVFVIQNRLRESTRLLKSPRPFEADVRLIRVGFEGSRESLDRLGVAALAVMFLARLGMTNGGGGHRGDGVHAVSGGDGGEDRRGGDGLRVSLGPAAKPSRR